MFLRKIRNQIRSDVTIRESLHLRGKKQTTMKNLFFTLTLLVCITALRAQPSAIHVEQHGTGDPLMFLPGFATPASVWDKTIQNIRGERTYYQVSYAGFNGLAPVDTPWYQNVRAALFAYVEKHDLRNLTLIGHSMGGNLATEVAAAMPERVKQLIIVDAIPCMRALMMPGVDAKHIRYDSPQVLRMLRMSEDSLRQTVVMTAQNMTLRPERVDTLVRWMMRADRETYVYGYTDLLKMDLRPQLDRITAETLILGAPFPDEQVVRENYAKQYANLANKSIRMAPDSRHFIMLDQPTWLHEQINSALTDEK